MPKQGIDELKWSTNSSYESGIIILMVSPVSFSKNSLINDPFLDNNSADSEGVR